MILNVIPSFYRWRHRLLKSSSPRGTENSRNRTLSALALPVHIILLTPSITLLHRNATSEGSAVLLCDKSLAKALSTLALPLGGLEVGREGNVASSYETILFPGGDTGG